MSDDRPPMTDAASVGGGLPGSWALDDDEASRWPHAVRCPPLGEAVVEPDPILAPHLTPSIFETENGTP